MHARDGHADHTAKWSGVRGRVRHLAEEYLWPVVRSSSRSGGAAADKCTGAQQPAGAARLQTGLYSLIYILEYYI